MLIRLYSVIEFCVWVSGVNRVVVYVLVIMVFFIGKFLCVGLEIKVWCKYRNVLYV